ncbi:MAG: hypothetical protein DRI69_09320 [Bacteroidetes bacterium]|nr:MAG: hypothetical protein DRI69_09320 [Bacteroidota bacterium]
MKLARTIAVLTVIVAFPAISWYYLQQGAAWRIEGLEAMRDKVSIELPHTSLIDINGETIAGIGVDFVIAVNVDPEMRVADLNDIADLFKHRGDVMLLSFNGGSPELDEAWTVVDCTTSETKTRSEDDEKSEDDARSVGNSTSEIGLKSNCDAWTNQFFKGNSNAVLIDDSLYIRNTYDLNEPGQMKLLAEHGVILFPVKRSKKIELKRGHHE